MVYSLEVDGWESSSREFVLAHVVSSTDTIFAYGKLQIGDKTGKRACARIWRAR